jgi:phage tail protein X
VRKLKNLLKSRIGLSTVVTTLIILVVSVLLATVVTYFAINVTSTRVQEEALHLTKQHIWHNGGTSGMTSQAAIMIINTGGRDIVIDKVTVRGQTVDWTDIYYCKTTASISADLAYNTTLADNNNITIGGTDYLFEQGTSGEDLTLRSGYTLILYMYNPDSVSVNDIGLTVAITIYTSQAMYYKECNVQAHVS